MNADWIELIQLFNDRKIKYLIIGGHAVMHYTEPRYTKDLDLLILANKENGKKVYDALKEFGAGLGSVTEETFSTEGFFYKLGAEPFRVDILTSAKGVDFDKAYKRRSEVSFEKVILPFVSKKDLISMKKAAGRLVDLLDIENLEKD